MYRFLIVLCLFVTTIVQGQQSVFNPEKFFWEYRILRNDSTFKSNSIISAFFRYNVNSTSITNSFANKFLFGGYINDDLKNEVIKRNDNKNRVGYDLETGIYGRYRKNDFIYEAGISKRQFLSSTFSNNTFQLIFNGNQSFAGQTIDITPFKFTMVEYEKFFINAGKLFKDKGLIVGGGISFIRGESFRNIEVERAQLYTEPNGAYIDLDAKFKMLNTGRKPGFIQPAYGAGGAINLYATKSFKKGILDIQIRDIGFIHYNNITTTQGDSNYRFSGHQINNIFATDQSLNSGINADTVLNELNITKEKHEFNYVLPITFEGAYTQYINDQWLIQSGINFFTKMNHFPRLSVSPQYCKNGWALSTTFATGGYGKFDFEARVARNFSRYFISVNFFYLERLILPSKSSGQGINVNLAFIY